MTALTIVRLGHPALRRTSVDVSPDELATSDFQSFLDDLADTCKANNGAGIAAPQVGVNKRVIVVNVRPDNPRYPGRPEFPLTIVINPLVETTSDVQIDDWEGDLSAGIRGVVPRAESCTVSGLLRDGQPSQWTLTDNFHSRVFLHEIDHLDGVFFIDRVQKRETISELAEWETYWRDAPMPLA